MIHDYLRGLRETHDVLKKGWVSAKNLALKTDVTRQTAYSRMKGLEKLGFTIEHSAARMGKIGPLSQVYRLTATKDESEKLFGREENELVQILGPSAKPKKVTNRRRKARTAR